MKVKKLNIRIVYGCGHVSVMKCNSRKQSDAEFKRLSCGDKIFDGHKYTSDYTCERTK
jgi:hypothetical protein